MTALFRSTVLLFLLSSALVCFGQSCPKLTVEGPNEVPRVGSTVEFRVKADLSAELPKLTFNWSVSSGQIIDGQGTDRIHVKSFEMSLTAAVDTSTDTLICENGASETISYRPLPCGLRVIADAYGDLPKNDENAHIDNLWYQGKNDPNSVMYLYLDILSNETIKNAQTRARRILSRFHYRENKFDSARLIFGVRQGGRHLTTAYYIPAGVSLPECKDGCTQFNGSELRP